MVSTVHSHAALRLADQTPLTKALVSAGPHGGVAAFRSSVANVACDVNREDVRTSDGTERSYPLQCERSFGQYLFDTLLDAGREFDIEVEGFRVDRALTDEQHE